jgi:phage tail sheath gpL-like
MPISDAILPSAVASVVGIKTLFKNLKGTGNIIYLPQQLAVIGQGATAITYSTDKIQLTSASDVGDAFGYGSPIHLASMEIFPLNGDGVGTIPVTFFPLADGDTEATGSITPTDSQTVAGAYQVNMNGILSNQFVISVGDSIADICDVMTTAINANLNMPMLAVDGATVVTLTSKWKGTSANDINISITDVTDGATFVLVQPTGGLVNPTVGGALAQIGEVWYTMALNCLDIVDTDAIEAYETFGEGRWGATTKKPMIFFTGDTQATVALASALPETYPTYRNNGLLVAPDSGDLPFVVGARQLARMIVVADVNPPRDYQGQKATGINAGADGNQWTYLERDQAVKAGCSTIEVRDDIVTMSDTVTFFHPAVDLLPEYRYVVDIVKLQNIIFNLDLIFNAPDWAGAPLLPDADPTSNRSAKKPRMAKAVVATMLDSLGLEAIISDPETAKKNTIAEIDGSNPKRLNLVVPVQLSGNVNIISVNLEFGFYFGEATIVA